MFQIDRNFHVLMDLLTTSTSLVRGNHFAQPSVLWLNTVGQLLPILDHSITLHAGILLQFCRVIVGE